MGIHFAEQMFCLRLCRILKTRILPLSIKTRLHLWENAMSRNSIWDFGWNLSPSLGLAANTFDEHFNAVLIS